MAERVVIQATPRTVLGKKVATSGRDFAICFVSG